MILFLSVETCLGGPSSSPSCSEPLPSTHKQKTQPTWSCKSNKSLDQYCKYNFYSPTNFSQELFVMKLVFCLQTKIGGLVTSQNLSEKNMNLPTSWDNQLRDQFSLEWTDQSWLEYLE